ncbi:bifunctional 5,10-methylenetetrahydrofolate dehydrogenase/5,10-methenyltetrahydrofolate cyclohydrolase [Ureaplasma urealyticum]|uniref:methenyltetrahydrofolate cyclohydrolase n=3 Tax=Ureaplasma urealyticum TaxID=2130 RepID=A0AAP9D7G5_UREUR|nr:bifunctional 5,10-methylenetetrahydrofolate dehydrogenase/5,10-methenyltetrahydrofolate cyclohydrolase [Ureaplasma urealyticum]EDX53923.1 methylenetetrahydrofolate dehydrogenase [Ureaplasma urealyticum serovar 9 str. ATCC 33175]ACI60199.1 methylenetetrahydrofolate dehydrogenase [Ureaplasma urealyticum serovar 10 str. ATCC 33699]EDT49298.1 methylenetetrahydrofolate dehydrogenase [Ureaplasma urealyticum serovar 13 str. ATCC 33698]EDU05979.1 methylenetetrahydrofolate dehydrogenase [Ureaplasma u
MKLKINFLYEKILNELLNKKNKNHKKIYVFYDSDLVNFNSAYIQSKLKYAKLFCVDVIIYDLNAYKIQDNHQFLAKLKQDNTDFLFFEFPLSNKHLEQNYFQYLTFENDLDGINSHLFLDHQRNQIIYHPATINAILALIQALDIDLVNYRICIIGRSIYLGNYLYKLLNVKNNSIKVIHSQTKKPLAIIKQSNFIISCVNKAHIFSSNDLSNNSYLIDVTTEYVNNKLCGSFLIDQNDVSNRNIKYTPVPGGIGKLTTLFLFLNYFK